jgi:hypothetical protein
MSWTRKNIFIGAHLWWARKGLAFTSPAAGTIDVNNIPDEADPLWDSFSLGVIESFQIDPKFASAESIMAPMPGRLVKTKVIVPYQEPMIAFTLKEIPKEAIEMALGTQALTDTSTTFNPTAGTPGMEGYLRAQKYDQENNLILNYQVWAFLRLKAPLKGDPKAMTKPEFEAEVLYSVNNQGLV